MARAPKPESKESIADPWANDTPPEGYFTLPNATTIPWPVIHVTANARFYSGVAMPDWTPSEGYPDDKAPCVVEGLHAALLGYRRRWTRQTTPNGPLHWRPWSAEYLHGYRGHAQVVLGLRDGPIVCLSLRGVASRAVGPMGEILRNGLDTMERESGKRWPIFALDLLMLPEVVDEEMQGRAFKMRTVRTCPVNDVRAAYVGGARLRNYSAEMGKVRGFVAAWDVAPNEPPDNARTAEISDDDIPF